MTSEIRVEQAYYRGLIGSPKTKDDKRTLAIPEPLAAALLRRRRLALPQTEEELVFQTRNHTRFSDTNLATQEPETGRSKNGATLAQLAHFGPDSGYALATRKSYGEGSASVVRSHQDARYARNLHRLDSASPQRQARGDSNPRPLPCQFAVLGALERRACNNSV